MSFDSSSKNDIVLISDEEEDDASERPSTTIVRPGTAASNTNENTKFQEQSSNRYNLDDVNSGDGRRVSRRRKNKNENGDETKNDTKNVENSRAGRSSSNSNDHLNESSQKHSATSAYSNERKYGNAENRAETRNMRKRERSPSPVAADVKETESISYKEVLSGLEGAAFQSRYAVCTLYIIIIHKFTTFYFYTLFCICIVTFFIEHEYNN